MKPITANTSDASALKGNKIRVRREVLLQKSPAAPSRIQNRITPFVI
jgi:hypothetical protein